MILTATKTFQLLIEISAHLESQGFVASEEEDYDAKVGYLVAKWVSSNNVDQEDVFLIANTLFIYCGYDALRRFCDDVQKLDYEIPYDFYEQEADFIVHGHPGLKIIGAMDIYDLAAKGRQLGWKRDWCPFRNNAEVLWYAGWDGVSRQTPELTRATQILAQIISKLS